MSLTKQSLIAHEDTLIVISGYAKKYCNQYITNDIINIIVTFFDPSIKWVVSTKKIPKNCRNYTQYLRGDTIIVDKVKFTPMLEFCNYTYRFCYFHDKSRVHRRHWKTSSVSN